MFVLELGVLTSCTPNVHELLSPSPENGDLEAIVNMLSLIRIGHQIVLQDDGEASRVDDGDLPELTPIRASTGVRKDRLESAEDEATTVEDIGTKLSPLGSNHSLHDDEEDGDGDVFCGQRRTSHSGKEQARQVRI